MNYSAIRLLNMSDMKWKMMRIWIISYATRKEANPSNNFIDPNHNLGKYTANK